MIEQAMTMLGPSPKAPRLHERMPVAGMPSAPSAGASFWTRRRLLGAALLPWSASGSAWSTLALRLIARGYTEIKRGDAKKSQTTQTTTEK